MATGVLYLVGCVMPKVPIRFINPQPSTASIAPVWSSGNQNIPATNQWTTYNHTLGRKPYLLRLYLICASAEGVFAAGDELSVIDWQANGSSNFGSVSRSTAALVGIYVWGGLNPLISNAANWRLRIDLW